MGKYFSLCNYGYLDSTEPVGQRKWAREWGLPEGNGSVCAGNFRNKHNYDWYEFGLVPQWAGNKFDAIVTELQMCNKL